MRPPQAPERCPRCGEICVGSFNSLCLTCYTRVEGYTAIEKVTSDRSELLSILDARARGRVVVRSG